MFRQMFKHKNTEVAHYPVNSKKQKDRTVINTLDRAGQGRQDSHKYIRKDRTGQTGQS